VVPRFGVHRFLVGLRRVNDRRHVDPGSSAGATPQQMRTDTPQSEAHQHDWNPLVVGERSPALESFGLRARQSSGHWLVESGEVGAEKNIDRCVSYGIGRSKKGT